MRKISRFDFQEPLKRLKEKKFSINIEKEKIYSMPRLIRNFAAHGKDNIKVTWSKYGPDSTIPGLGHYSREKTGCMRIFWALVSLVCIVCLCYNFTTLTSKYFDYEKRTNIDMTFDMNPFPAVTVCSLNPYKLSEAKKVRELSTLMNALNAAVKTVKVPKGSFDVKQYENEKGNELGVPNTKPKKYRRKKRNMDSERVTMCSCNENEEGEECRTDLNEPGEIIICACLGDSCQSCDDAASCKYYTDNKIKAIPADFIVQPQPIPIPTEASVEMIDLAEVGKESDIRVTVCYCEKNECRDMMKVHGNEPVSTASISTCVCHNDRCQSCPDPANCYFTYSKITSTRKTTRTTTTVKKQPKLITTTIASKKVTTKTTTTLPDVNPKFRRTSLKIQPLEEPKDKEDPFDSVIDLSDVVDETFDLMTLCDCTGGKCTTDLHEKPEEELTLCICRAGDCVLCRNPADCNFATPTKLVATTTTIKTTTTAKTTTTKPRIRLSDHFYTRVTVCECDATVCHRASHLLDQTDLETCVCLESDDQQKLEQVSVKDHCQECQLVSHCQYIFKQTTTTSSSTTTTSTTTITTTTTPIEILTTQGEVILEEENVYGFDLGSDQIAMQTKAQESLPFITAFLDPEVKKKISVQKDEFIRNCAFNTKSCDIKNDFIFFHDAKYGNCFTFNYNSSNQIVSTRAGPIHGLRLILLSNVTDYMTTTETAGSRIIIHDPSQYPFPDSFGFNAPIGMATSFGVRSSVISRIPPPFGMCNPNVDNIDMFFTGKYTVEGCTRSCYQRKVINQCGCGDPRFPLPNKDNHTSQFCSQDNTIAKDCINELSEQSINSKICHCPVPCNETVYLVTVSSSVWPFGTDQVPGCGNGQGNTDVCRDTKKSGLMVEIYYEQLSFQVMWESPAYTYINLFSDMAGQVGFWAGVCMISLVEFFVFCGRIMFTCCKKGREWAHEDVSEVAPAPSPPPPSPPPPPRTPTPSPPPSPPRSPTPPPPPRSPTPAPPTPPPPTPPPPKPKPQPPLPPPPKPKRKRKPRPEAPDTPPKKSAYRWR